MAAARHQVAFYASTQAYLPVLEQAGFADIQPPLLALSRAGDWQSMAPLIPNDLLKQVMISGSPQQVAEQVVATRGGWADRVSPVFYQVRPDLMVAISRSIEALS